jgi:hypothetical protein
MLHATWHLTQCYALLRSSQAHSINFFDQSPPAHLSSSVASALLLGAAAQHALEQRASSAYVATFNIFFTRSRWRSIDACEYFFFCFSFFIRDLK